MKVTFGLSEFHKQALTDLVLSHTLLPKYQGPMADLAGAINAAWPNVPPPDPGDPLARMRLAPSQLSMWAKSVLTADEISAMHDLHNVTRVAQQIAFYSQGMPGNVTVRRTGPSTYDFVKDEVWTPDVNGAGDALVAANAAATGTPVIGPLTP